MRHLLANKTDVTGDAQSPNSTSVVENFAAQVKARSRPALLLISSGILLIVAIGLFAGLTVYQLRERAVAKTGRELSNTALILAEHSDRIFQSIELVEDSLVEQIQSLDIHSSDDLARYMSGRTVHLRLKDKLNGLPHASSLALIDADGKLINSSDDQPDFSVNVADHDYFTALKSDGHLNSFLSQTLRDVKDGTWKVFLAHRLVGADGEFLGIVVAGINLNHFRNFFTSISLGEHSWISLLRSNGVQLIRYPYDERTIGRAYPATIEALGTKTAARTRLISHNCGRARLVGLHRLTHYPLLISIGMDTESVLADWREQAKALVIAAAFAAFVIVCVIFLITRDLLHGQRQSQQKLREQRLHLDTALNNMRQGLLMFDTRGRLILCNKRFLQMYGLESDAVKPGCTLSDLLRLRKAAGTFSGEPRPEHGETLRAREGRGKGHAAPGRALRLDHKPIHARHRLGFNA